MGREISGMQLAWRQIACGCLDRCLKSEDWHWVNVLFCLSMGFGGILIIRYLHHMLFIGTNPSTYYTRWK